MLTLRHKSSKMELEHKDNQELNFEKVWQMFQETREQMRETDKKMRETDKKIKALTNLFTSQWGKLMEALIMPSCLKLFRVRGINVSQTYTNIVIDKENRKIAEFDIVLSNGTEIVVVEVKTTMKKEDVDYFLEKMARIRVFFPKWADMKFYGALAAIKYDENTERLGYRHGLFILTNSGEGIIKIANDPKFVPDEF